MEDYRDVIYDLKKKVKEANDAIKDAEKKLRASEKETAVFLKKCSEYGIKKVSIGKHPGENWPFGARGSVFTFSGEKAPEGKHRSSWPAIWGVVEELGISTGCGNTDQHNVGNENLMEGVYELKKGKWNRID